MCGGILTSMDIFRRVPRDLTEATRLGGCISIIAVCMLAALAFLQMQSLREITLDTRIEISHREDDDFQINLNITFPAISCDWLSINLLDIIGRREANLSSPTLHKHTLHGSYVATKVQMYDQPMVEPENMPEAHEVFAKAQKVMALTPDTYDTIIHQHRVVIVNFFAPWCPYCVALAPLYDEAAEDVSTKVTPTYDVVFATVNCVDPENFELCQEQHIQVFPTLRVYRDGSNNPHGAHVHMHEEYRGPRTPQSISAFAVNVLKEVREKRAQIGDQAEADSNRPRNSNDPKSFSEYSFFGCTVSGHIKVNRVPGSLVFLPIAEGHNFHAEAINMSHVINHLSFGKHPFSRQSVPEKYRENVPGDLGGAYSGKDNADHATLFLSLTGHLSHEHYVKVVTTLFQPLEGQSVETYEYNVNSHLYTMPDQEIPSVKFVWDIWPMEVINEEIQRPLIEGICQMLGFLGGVFSFFMSLAWLLEGTWKRLIRAQDTKPLG